MREPCIKFDTPVTGGNVSFYNQSTDGEAVFPTPTIGMVGLLDTEEHMTLDFKQAGDIIVMLGKPQDDLGCSQYLVAVQGVEHSPAPYFNLDEEYILQQCIKQLIAENTVASVHDIAEGGLFITLLESAKHRNVGFDIRTDASFRKDAYLFGEAQSRVVLSLSLAQWEKVQEIAAKYNVPATRIGSVTPGSVSVDGDHWGQAGDFAHIYDTM